MPQLTSRARGREKTVYVGLRMPESLVARATREAHRRQREGDTQGVSGLIRAALNQYLPLFEGTTNRREATA
jgi:hypothetical protein